MRASTGSSTRRRRADGSGRSQRAGLSCRPRPARTRWQCAGASRPRRRREPTPRPPRVVLDQGPIEKAFDTGSCPRVIGRQAEQAQGLQRVERGYPLGHVPTVAPSAIATSRGEQCRTPPLGRHPGSHRQVVTGRLAQQVPAYLPTDRGVAYQQPLRHIHATMMLWRRRPCAVHGGRSGHDGSDLRAYRHHPHRRAECHARLDRAVRGGGVRTALVGPTPGGQLISVQPRVHHPDRCGGRPLDARRFADAARWAHRPDHTARAGALIRTLVAPGAGGAARTGPPRGPDRWSGTGSARWRCAATG